MKTINLELSKRLTEGWYLEDVETDYYRMENIFWDYVLWDKIDKSKFYPEWDKVKTLTLEEAIEFLPKKHPKYKEYYLRMMLYDKTWYVEYWMCEPCETMWSACWKTLLEAIEKMLEHLLDNDLLWKTFK